MDKNIDNYIGTKNLSLIEAMQRIDKNAAGILYIIDDEGHLDGSLSDGDIRRCIIKTGRINDLVCDAYNRNTRFVFNSEIDKADRLFKEYKLHSVPVLDINRRIIDIIFNQSTVEHNYNRTDMLSATPVIIMAGGKGTRLYPYTKILPKPLVPIGDIPIIERILSQFHKYGVDSFYIILNYKKEMIKAYFVDQNLPYHIDFVDENNPLGTAGGIRLIDQIFDGPVIITNCDILIQTNYDKIIEHHCESKNDMTIVSSLRTTVIPYGVIHSREEGVVEKMEEKPRISSFINTGMYVLNPEFIDWIPYNSVFHMTDLAKKMIEAKKRVGMYPISEDSFLDMGEFEEMKKMEDMINPKA